MPDVDSNAPADLVALTRKFSASIAGFRQSFPEHWPTAQARLP